MYNNHPKTLSKLKSEPFSNSYIFSNFPRHSKTHRPPRTPSHRKVKKSSVTKTWTSLPTPTSNNPRQRFPAGFPQPHASSLLSTALQIIAHRALRFLTVHYYRRALLKNRPLANPTATISMTNDERPLSLPYRRA